MMHRIGILSDTHLYCYDESFCQLAGFVFQSCNTIIHAGDITDLSVLDCFQDKSIIAVHGNMCNLLTTQTLPESSEITIAGYKIAVCHGAGNRSNIENRLFERFYDADCIIYGHTHKAVNHRIGKTLFINPGSFFGTGPYGSSGTYAILELDTDFMEATLHEVKEQK